MRKRWAELLLVAALGAFFPLMALSLAPSPVDVNVPTGEETVPQIPEETQSQIETQNPTETTVPAPQLTLPVHMQDGSVQQMEMDTYLTGVVLGEMPADFEVEALKAQAVVARTYALRRDSTGDKHAGVCTDSGCCQAYRDPQEYLASGGLQENLDKIKAAVTATTAQVLTYDGQLIDATYFSCSGGKTEDAAAVWGLDVPYLQAVDSPGEEKAPRHTETVTFSKAELQSALDIELSGNWLGKITYTEGGGVDTIQIGNTTFKGTTLRQLLGLRSTAFVITAVGDTVTITTKGFGHRVGMSQYGAEAMAVTGSTYRQILSHYYLGTTLETWSAD